MPLLVAACPSFEAAWREYAADDLYDADLVYVHLGELARHVVELAAVGRAAHLAELFRAIERLNVEGDAYVREAACVGALEAIQNEALHRGVPLALFEPLLLSESARSWYALERFWAGRAPRAGARGGSGDS